MANRGEPYSTAKFDLSPLNKGGRGFTRKGNLNGCKGFKTAFKAILFYLAVCQLSSK